MTRFKILIFVSCFLFLVSSPVFGQPAAPTDYELLAPIPQLVKPGTASTTNAALYIPGLFKFAIALAGALAVIRLIWAGVKYMSTDAFTEKSEAKGIIEQALWGLLLAMSAWLIIATVNSDLVNFNFKIQRLEIQGTLGGGTLPSACTDCVSLVGLNEKTTGSCNTPGSCQINGELKNRLVDLNRRFTGGITITESYPPTVTHQASCHRYGTCVDTAAVIGSQVYNYTEAARQARLRAVYEVESETRKNAVISDSCGTSNQACRDRLGACIAVLPRLSDGRPQITEEHFSIYMDNRPPCTI